MDDSDFRVRAARRKRERMRTRLLDATMDVCGRVGPGEQAVIDDVIRAADVSRGTFYKYFASLDEARRALGQHLTNELVDSVGAMFAEVADPVQRTAAGWILIMARAVGHPAWGAFVVRTEQFNEDSQLLAAIRRNTTAGQQAGSFRIDHLDAAIDFQMGVALEAMRHLLRDPSDAADYILATTTIGLRGLGLPHGQAVRSARAAMDDVAARAPRFLPWWRPLD
jgi:AcrR family transcriptional regulator